MGCKSLNCDSVLYASQGSRVCGEPNDSFRRFCSPAGESICIINSLFLDQVLAKSKNLSALYNRDVGVSRLRLSVFHR